MSLTRTDLEESRFQTLMRESGLDYHVLTEAELQASIDRALADVPPQADIWLFAYGSLIWNPVFHHVDRQVGLLSGWHRQFCLWTPLGRGTPENPGLVLALDQGGSCQGIVYRIAAAEVRSELLLLWRREMIVGSYIPRWVTVLSQDRQLAALTFTINHDHRSYAGRLPQNTIVEHIATAVGHLGTCADYLLQTVDGLETAGIRDPALLELRDRVVERQMQLQQNG